MQINPAILTDSLATFAQQLELIKQQPDIKVVQVDIIDALFADNITINPSDLLDFDFGDLLIDFHLMTEEPMDYVWELIECGQALPTHAVIAQLEKMSYQTDFLAAVKKADWQAGLALNLYTPLESIEKTAWEHVDHILLMAVEAGAQGQSFNSLVLDKVKELKMLINKSNKVITISVDGGVKIDQVKILKEAGVDQITVGSALFNADNFGSEFNKFLKELV